MIDPLLKGAILEVKGELKKKDDRRLEELKKDIGELKSQNKKIITQQTETTELRRAVKSQKSIISWLGHILGVLFSLFSGMFCISFF